MNKNHKIINETNNRRGLGVSVSGLDKERHFVTNSMVQQQQPIFYDTQKLVMSKTPPTTSSSTSSSNNIRHSNQLQQHKETEIHSSSKRLLKTSKAPQHYYTAKSINGEILYFDSHGQLILNYNNNNHRPTNRNAIQTPSGPMMMVPVDYFPSSQLISKQKPPSSQLKDKTAIKHHFTKSSISPPNSIATTTTTTSSNSQSSQSTNSDLIMSHNNNNNNNSNNVRLVNGMNVYLPKQPIIDEEGGAVIMGDENGSSSPPNSMATTTTNSNSKK